VASQVGIAGNCTIGNECHIAGQAGIVHGVTIGNRCALLNAAGVAQDLPDDSVIVGQHSTVKPYPSSRILHLL
jgi:UDP-3-O-[3-hydroxymyristoyl] glucosamine N-acyltransferase